MDVHSGAITLEEDHGVVDQAGEDAVEVEPAADVPCHPPQGLGAVEEVGDLLLAPDDADDGTDGVGEDRDQVAIGGTEAVAGRSDDKQASPGSVATRDGRCELLPIAGKERGRHPVIALAFHSERTGRDVRPSSGATVGEVECPAQDAERSRHIQQTRHGDAGWYGHGSRGKPVVPALPDDHHRAVAGVADEIGDPIEVLVQRGLAEWLAGDRVEECEVAPMPVGVGRVEERREIDPALILAPVWVAARAGRRASGVMGTLFGGCEEPLQVAEPIPPVAARVDPVEAQPSRVAPRTDRVRVHAEQTRGLGDGQGRVGRARRQVRAHDPDGGTVKCTGAEATNLTVLANRPKVPASRGPRDPHDQARPTPGHTDVDRGRRAPPPRPIARTSTIAVSGSPTSPGPSPLLRGSPPITALGEGVAAAGACRYGAKERPGQPDRQRRPARWRARSRRPAGAAVRRPPARASPRRARGS